MKDPLSHRRAGFTLVELLVTFIIVFLLFSFLASPDLIIHTCFGWYFYLTSTSAKIRFDFWTILQFALVCMAFLGLAHYIARSFLPHSEIIKTWRSRNSVSMLLGLFVSFTAGLAFVGTVHQFGWLAREPKIFLGNESRQRTRSRNNLKEMGNAVEIYHDQWNSFPAGGTLLTQAIPGHSWQTLILPYADHQGLFNQIDLQQPWFSPKNKQPFATELGTFSNEAIPGKTRDERTGYAISHYAENSHLTGLGKPISKDDIKDGMSTTLFAGEVVSNFKPWADPTNRRDPTLGLNTSPQGFGGPWKGGATGFLMVDGSTRMISKDIDPKILKALATPNGNEPIPEHW